MIDGSAASLDGAVGALVAGALLGGSDQTLYAPGARYPSWGEQGYGDPRYDPRFGEQGWGYGARGWVPMDDGHTMFVFIWWKKAKSAQALPHPRFKDGTRPFRSAAAT